MQLVEELDSETIERLGKQSEFLLMVHHAELAKDPASRATESSRSNLMAAQHTIKQVYGDAVARQVADLVTPTAPILDPISHTLDGER
jgi:hypothetical protein